MKLFSIPLIILFSATSLPASDPALTLGDALARAAAHNPRLLAADATGRAADALIEQAGVRPNPVLGVTLENFAGTGTARGVDSLESTVEISQTIERGAKREKRTALATRARDTAASELAVLRAATLAATATAYLETLAAQQRLALAAAPEQLARDTLAAADSRVQTGAGSPAESARARAALASARAEIVRRETELAAARARLAATWGGAADDVPALAAQLRAPDTLPDPARLLPNLTAHPRLALQRNVIAGRRAALAVEQSHAVQDVNVAGGVRFLRESTDAAFVAGISVPLPVRHKNQGGIRAARETLAGAELTADAVESELRAEFTAAWQELSAAHRALLALRRDALPATEEAFATVRRAYDEGLLPLIDVLDAQRALAGLRRELLDHEAACALALARLEALANPTFSATSALISLP